MTKHLARAAFGTLVLTSTLAGCAGLPQAAGRDRTVALLQSRAAPSVAESARRAAQLADDSAVDRDVAEWRKVPLSADTAVRIALLRNPGLQARFASLGLSAADVFEAARLHNPQVDVALLMPRGDAVGNKFSAGLTFGFTDALLRRSSQRMAESEFARIQADVADAVLSLVTETQRAWVDAVAAAQRLAVRQAVEDLATTSAQLAARYHEAGNLSLLDLQVQQAAASEARLSLQRTRAESVDATVTLQKLMGLTAAEAWTVPSVLPAPDVQPELAFSALRERAGDERLDLIAARHAVATLEEQLRVTRGTRWLGRTDLGVGLEREADGTRRAGPRFLLELPLFQQGQGRMARDAARLAQARAAVRRIEVDIDADLQQQLQRVEIARMAVGEYRNTLIPRREAIVGDMQRRTNQMLVDTFTLLLAKQQEQSSYEGYVDAVQDYWRSRVALLHAAGTQLVAALHLATGEKP